MTHPIAITTGEPAGIGPDIALAVASQNCKADNAQDPLILVGNADLLAQRAQALKIQEAHNILEAPNAPLQPNAINIFSIPLSHPVHAGELDPANAPYVLETLKQTVQHIEAGHWRAMVTAPLHKGVIIEAGFTSFMGHTEFLAEQTKTDSVVMMLATGDFRVALATTHLPLKSVPEAITQPDLLQCLSIIHTDLQKRYGIQHPRIGVCGLNPHAGEQGHIGREEVETIIPAVQKARANGIDASDPLPADTIFTAGQLNNFDVILAMYHDQGLPVLKYAGFGQAINITLGLPLVRTSVDHGTALDLAGTGKAQADSLHVALLEAKRMTQNISPNSAMN